MAFHAVAAIVAMFVVCGAQASEVQTSAFTIDLPGDFPSFEKKQNVQGTGESAVETTTWISRSPSTSEAVIVAVSKMPGKIVDAEKLFDKTRDALASSLKGTVETDEAATQTMPARRLFMRTAGAFIRARLMVSGSDLYQILYVARSSEHLTSNDVASIFSSVRLR